MRKRQACCQRNPGMTGFTGDLDARPGTRAGRMWVQDDHDAELTFTLEAGFARDTVRKSMQLLVDEGQLYIVRGLGTFVVCGR